ncbi:hypothetical protein HDV05_006019, partial [Chytridiales sp. JEL 0842]
IKAVEDESGTSTLRTLSDIPSNVSLFIHVAVSLGTISHVILGVIDERLDYCIHGKCLDELGQVLDATGKGELGISKDSLAVLSEPIKRYIEALQPVEAEKYLTFSHDTLAKLYEFIQPNFPDLKEPVLHDNSFDGLKILRLFINQSLLIKADRQNNNGGIKQRRLSVSNTESQVVTSEFRMVSIIFVKLKSTFTPERAQKAAVGFITLLKQAEGVFQQFSVDDKGQTMLGCFGLPPWTHEKEPLYALRTAVAFAEFVKANKMVGEVSIGVATGDCVNVSARLLSIQSEHSPVKCDKATFLATREDFSFISLGPQKVKGKQEPIEIWCVSDKQDRLSSAPTKTVTSFGYKKEKDMLKAAINAWKSIGDCQKIVIEGPSGIGKSRLIDFLGQEAHKADIPYCLTQASEIKAFSPYFAIQNVFNFLFRKFTDNTSIRGGFNDDAYQNIAQQDRSLFSISTRSTSITSKGRSTSSNIMFTSRAELSNGTKETNASRSPYHDAVRAFLLALDEDPALAPILSELLPFLNIADTPLTKNMDAQARSALLKSMVVRIINKAMDRESFIVIFDDCQWMDPMSLELLLSIVRGCPHVMLVMLSRPIREFNLAILEKITGIQGVSYHVLSGLEKSDVGEILVHMLSEFGAKSISERVLTTVMEKCKGLPLSVDTIGQSMSSEVGQAFVIDSNGAVDFNGNESEVALGKMTSIRAIVIQQFDRLDDDFQTILLKASIFGQYFTLEDLWYFSKNFSSPKEMEQFIQQHDKFQFLVKHGDESNDSIPFSSRAEDHLAVANYFESILTDLSDANRAFLLPLLAHHFQRTNNVSKQILYLEELGTKHFKQGHYLECENRMESLIRIAETSKPTSILNIDKSRHAYWLAILATVHVYLFKYGAAEIDLCMKALELLGEPFPKDEKEGTGAIFKTAFKLWRLWRRTRGGTKPLGPGLQLENDAAKSTGYSSAQINLLTYRCLFRLSIYTTLIAKRLKILILLSMLKTAIPWGFKDRHVWCGILYISGFGLSWSLVPLSKVYFNQAANLEKGLSDAEKEKLLEYSHVKGLGLHLRGKLTESQTTFRSVMRFFELRGDQSSYNMAMHGLQGVSVGTGDIYDLEPQLFQALNDPDSYQLPISLSLATARVFCDDLQLLKDRYHMARGVADAVNISLNESPLQCTLSWIAFHEGDYDAFLNHFEKTCQLFAEFGIYYGPVTDTIFETSPLAWMLLHPLIPGTTTNNLHIWSPPQRSRLKLSLINLQKAMCFYAVKCQFRLFAWSYKFVQASILFLEGKHLKSLKLLLNALKDRNMLEMLEDIPFHKALLHAILGLYVENEADRRFYAESAKKMFQSFRYTRLVKWVVEVDAALRASSGR